MKAVILVGHGSRDPAWRAAIDAVAARAQAVAPGLPVACAFLELQGPGVAEAASALVAAGAREISLFPLFLGLGRHAREDLPGEVARLAAAHPDVAFTLRASAGEDARVVELLAKIAVE